MLHGCPRPHIVCLVWWVLLFYLLGCCHFMAFLLGEWKALLQYFFCLISFPKSKTAWSFDLLLKSCNPCNLHFVHNMKVTCREYWSYALNWNFHFRVMFSKSWLCWVWGPDLFSSRGLEIWQVSLQCYLCPSPFTHYYLQVHAGFAWVAVQDFFMKFLSKESRNSLSCLGCGLSFHKEGLASNPCKFDRRS